MHHIFKFALLTLACCVSISCSQGEESSPPQPSATPPSTPTPAASPTPAAALNVGTPTTGFFAPALPVDTDGKPYVDYQLAVSTAGTYRFDLVSSNPGVYDPYIRLMQGTNELAHDDDGGEGLNSQLSHSLQPGTYTVRVTRFGSGQVTAPTPFTLTVSPATAGGTARAVTVGTPVTGAFTPGLPTDQHSKPYLDYQLTITAAGTYQINLVSSNTSVYDPYLRLMQGTNELAHDDDGAGNLQSRIQHQLQPGSYTIRVTKFGSGQVASPVPFTLSVVPSA